MFSFLLLLVTRGRSCRRMLPHYVKSVKICGNLEKICGVPPPPPPSNFFQGWQGTKLFMLKRNVLCQSPTPLPPLSNLFRAGKALRHCPPPPPRQKSWLCHWLHSISQNLPSEALMEWLHGKVWMWPKKSTWERRLFCFCTLYLKWYTIFKAWTNLCVYGTHCLKKCTL